MRTLVMTICSQEADISPINPMSEMGQTKTWRQVCRAGAPYPADIPAEQPIKFEHIVILKAANALGLAIP
jgi:hypothetical protein